MMDIISWIIRLIYFVMGLIGTFQNVIERFLPLLTFAIFLAAVATLFVAVRTSRRVRKLARSSQSRSDFLRDQQERLEMLHNEHRLLVEKLEHEDRLGSESRQVDEQADR